MSQAAQWKNSRRVIERIFVRGELVLDTPAQFGGMDEEGATDMPLLYDPYTGTTPLLTGASIAGALRAYLRAYENGHEWAEQRDKSDKSWAEALFGHLDDSQLKDPEEPGRASVLSWLMVDDALGCLPAEASVERRDGVALDPKTRTVQDKSGRGQKYDMELLPAGTTFPIRFEFWKTEDNAHLLNALLVALHGLETGQIGLGRRKRRGLGACRVTNWQVARYDMGTVDGLMGWLRHDGDKYSEVGDSITRMPDFRPLSDARQAFTLRATFALDSSLLVRSYSGDRDEPDMVHLRSWRDGGEKPILPATSLVGALRARALRIANTMRHGAGKPLVDAMFGRDGDQGGGPTGSRLLAREAVVTPRHTNLVQSRVKLDRFTGGAYPQALFEQMPVWGHPDSQRFVEIYLELRCPHNFPPERAETDFEAQVGLLLLVLKDLWTGDLPLGGESSVGRGRLRGIEATLRTGEQEWKLERDGEKVIGDGVDALEGYVAAFLGWAKEGS